MLLRRMLLACVVGMGAMLSGCASDRQVIGQAQQLHGGIQPAVISDPALNDYITRMGDRIIDAAQEMYQQRRGPDAAFSQDANWMFTKRMRFHLVASEELNAFTTGGEHMYIYTGLFRQAKTEDELAAVMAHEFAHVYGRHVHRGMNRQYAIIGASAVAGGAGYALADSDKRMEYAGAFAGAAAIAGQFVGKGFTRGDETEADEYGFQFYVRAGWDPDRFGDFFQQMIDKGYDKSPEMLSDHPSLANRVKNSERYADDLPANARSWRQPPVASAARFRELQDRAGRIAKALPPDKSLQGAKVLLASFPSCVSPTETQDQKKAQAQVTHYLKQR